MHIVSKSYPLPLIVEKTVLLKIVSKALKERTTDACLFTEFGWGWVQSNHLFSCLFIARVGRDLEVANLFSSLFFLFYSIKMKQRWQRKCFGVGPKCCVWNFPPWLVSAQINNGVVKVSTASAFTAKVLLGACLPQPLPTPLPTWGTRHRLPQGPPFSGTT